MSDFTSNFWSIYVASITLVSILACLLLLWFVCRLGCGAKFPTRPTGIGLRTGPRFVFAEGPEHNLGARMSSESNSQRLVGESARRRAGRR